MLCQPCIVAIFLVAPICVPCRQRKARSIVVSTWLRPNMKTIKKSLAVSILIAAMGCSAFADGPRGYYPQGQHRNYQGRQHDSGWIAPLLFLGLAGAVIGAAASQQSAPPPTYMPPPVTYVQPAPTYVAPTVVVPAPPPQQAYVWYFCRSVGQYYPYTQYCPEGWQLVSPTPQ